MVGHVRSEGSLPYFVKGRIRLGSGSTTVENMEALVQDMLSSLALASATAGQGTRKVSPPRKGSLRPLGSHTMARKPTALVRYRRDSGEKGIDRAVHFSPVTEVAESVRHVGVQALGSKEADREHRLQQRLDAGSVVSHGYVVTTIAKARYASISDDRGVAVAFQGQVVETDVERLQFKSIDRFKVFGWRFYTASLKDGQEFVLGPPSPVAVARFDFGSQGRIRTKGMDLNTEALVVWLRGEVKFRYEGMRTKVRMSVSTTGEATGVGWVARLMQMQYVLPAVKLFDAQPEPMRLRVPLIWKQATDLGIARYQARFYTHDTGVFGLDFVVDAARAEVPAVISVSGVSVHSLGLSGCTVPASKNGGRTAQTVLLAVAWVNTCVLQVTAPGEVKVLVDVVSDRISFEEANTEAADSPVLGQLELPTRATMARN